MQPLYTRYSETHSSIRNVFARLRQSVLANSLRTITLLFLLALSCNVWGEEYGPFTLNATTDSKNALVSIAGADYKGGDKQHSFTITKVGSSANKQTDTNNFPVTDCTGDGKIYYLKVGKQQAISIKSEDSYVSKVSIVVGQNSTGKAILNDITYYFGTGTTKQQANLLGYNEALCNNAIVATATSDETEFILTTSKKAYIVIAISVWLKDKVSCTPPTINPQPVSATYSVGATPTPLQVAATGDALTYQWQSSTDNATFANISNATSDTYTPPPIRRAPPTTVVSSPLVLAPPHLSPQQSPLPQTTLFT